MYYTRAREKKMALGRFMKGCLSVFTLKYTFCRGWHSCWCLMLSDMIQRISWEVTQELERPIFNRAAAVPRSVQHNTKLIPLCLLQCSHSLFASFSPYQHLKAKSYWCSGHDSLCGYLIGKNTLAQGRKDNCQILTWKMVPALSLHFSTSEDIFLPLEDCLCWHSPGSTLLQSSAPVAQRMQRPAEARQDCGDGSSSKPRLKLKFC